MQEKRVDEGSPMWMGLPCESWSMCERRVESDEPLARQIARDQRSGQWLLVAVEGAAKAAEP